MRFADTIKRGMATLTGTSLTLVQNTRLSPNLAQIRFEGAIQAADWNPGDKLKLNAGGVLRSYTPSQWQDGALQILFHLHGQGPAAQWAAQAQVGETVSFIGPAKSLPPAQASDWHLLIGDPTTVGLFQALHQSARAPCHGVVELAPEDAPALDALGLPLKAVAQDGALEWISDWQPPSGRGDVVLSGEADRVRAWRDALLAQGLDKRWIRIKPYWSRRGKARRKAVEREMKGA